MRIAIPLSESTLTLSEQFSGASTFALYDVHDESRAVQYLGREAIADPACSRTPGFLREHKVEVIIAHQISANAEQHLFEAGIITIKDSPSLSPDALIAHLVSGTLQATPPAAQVEGGACGSGGCGGCCGGGQAQATACGSHAAAEHSCSH